MQLLRSFAAAAWLAAIAAPALVAQGTPTPTSPEAFFGHRIGADYRLVNYTRFSQYWERLATESDRMVLDTIGTTAEGRPQLMAIISSPANLAKREEYRAIVQRLARGDAATEADAAALAAQGKGIVWIDGGLHATEVVGPHQLIETVWQLVSRDDAETRRFRDELIVLAVHANPDGMELVSDWYLSEPDTAKRRTSGIPRLYQKYIGHDNNRDFYMITQPETRNMTRQMFREWLPQVVYNHHQTGPAGTVLFAPPFRDPHNHNIDPLVISGISLVGASMHQRFIAEGKPGSTMREGASYQTWWNGGLRTAVYFHNQIGLLTEIIGNPTPQQIPFIPDRLLSTGDLPYPIEPQVFRFRTAIDYSVTANWAVLDVVARHREQFLLNQWRMAKRAIDAGSRDHWTLYPRRIEAAKAALGASAERGVREGARERFEALLRDPAARDARAYVIPRDQRDFGTATRFVNVLIRGGVTVHRATAPFAAGGRTYPEGSYVVWTAQPFRSHVLDMFEPQDYPNDFQYPGGPPKPPYDAAGYTLAYQMGVDVDRVLDGFSANLVPLDEEVSLVPGVVDAPSGAGWVLDRSAVEAVSAANALLKGGVRVRELPGTQGWFVPRRGGLEQQLRRLARERGVSFRAVAAAPAGGRALRPVRIGLWDEYGGSMTSGWTRWLFEQFGFDYTVVYPQDLDAGNLAAKFDVLVFPDGALPRSGRIPDASSEAAPVPAAYRRMTGEITTKTVGQLRRFLESGGTVLAIGTATGLASVLDVPVTNHLVDAAGKPLPRERFYVPGSVLRVAVDTLAPTGRGMRAAADVMFQNSPVFRVAPGATGVRVVARFDGKAPLRSGWAWGQDALAGGAAVVEAQVGKGTLVLYGPEVLYRAQPWGTFPLFFNGLFRGGAEP